MVKKASAGFFEQMLFKLLLNEQKMNVWRFGATFLTFQNGWNDINGKLVNKWWKLWKYEDKLSKQNKFEEQKLRSWLFKMDEMTLMDN